MIYNNSMELGSEDVTTPEIKLSGQEHHVISEESREKGNFIEAVASVQSAFSAYLVEGNISNEGI